MNLMQFKNTILFFYITLISNIYSSDSLFDCQASRPEMAGLHNMIVFGIPGDQKYAYHLPLFAGGINGHHGHVTMHTYQGIWNIDFDEQTNRAYKDKFNNTLSDQNPIPLFSLSPKGDRFKVPDLICSDVFVTAALTVYGHVESNPNFPAPELLVNTLSKVKFTGRSVFARKFDGSSKKHLTYILFGTSKQQYLAHYLTDDENSFDQVLAVSVGEELIKEIENNNIIVSVPLNENNLNRVNQSSSLNNSFSIDVKNLLKVKIKEKLHSITIKSEIYFNNNSDLRVD